MYLPAIALNILGLVFFVVNIIYFFKEYSLVIIQSVSKKILVLNLMGLIFSFFMILSGITYFVLINSQL